MKSIISRVELSAESIRVFPSIDLQAYINKPLLIKASGIDFHGCPETIASMAFALNVAPILWRLGGIWQENRLDPTLVASLDKSRRAFAKLYPEYTFDGSIESSLPASEPAVDRKETVALLFSGGIDSTFSFLEVRHMRPFLLTVHGDDSSIRDQGSTWAHVRASAQYLHDSYGAKHVSIRSNFTDIFTPLVLRLFPYLHAGYWAAIQHGLGFVGIAAPIMHSLGSSTLIVGASYSVGHSAPWGSNPFIEGGLEWENGRVIHHGYHFNRIEKTEHIAKLIKTEGFNPTLLVCSNLNRADKNCMKCSKCLRTLANILVAGADPQDFGFTLTEPDTLTLLKQSVPKNLREALANRQFLGPKGT
jgi:hypothetical protein